MAGFWIRNCHSIYDVDGNLDSPLDNCQNLKKKIKNAQKYFKLKNRFKKNLSYGYLSCQHKHFEYEQLWQSSKSKKQ